MSYNSMHVFEFLEMEFDVLFRVSIHAQTMDDRVDHLLV